MGPDEKRNLTKLLTIEYMKAHPEIYQKEPDEIVNVFNEKYQKFKDALDNTYIRDWYGHCLLYFQ